MGRALYIIRQKIFYSLAVKMAGKPTINFRCCIGRKG